MAEYSKDEIRKIEDKWRQRWIDRKVYRTDMDPSKPKYYALDMFPYPSGAGLHVGHPLGYIASDIVARYKRVKGFNVLHPMGFDAFGLPAEQYAIEHGVHPAISTQENIQNFKRQLGKIGFCYDWDREVQTCDPKYYRWTQWIFLQIFDSWYNRKKEKAERIADLIKIFESEGNTGYPFPNSKFRTASGRDTFSASEWKSFDEKTKQELLMQYRLAYLAYTDVNWCEALGTVLANDEVINGVSYRGGFPVVKRLMRQWSLRITEYAERLLQGLEVIDFSESMKEIQRNWISKSVGAKITFDVKANSSLTPDPSPGERGSPTNVGTARGRETAEKKYWPILKEFSKENRKNQTQAELIVWEEVRNGKLGHKVRRQHAIGIFIADFVCLDKRLVIEIDGDYHLTNKEYDHARSAFLKSEGFDLIRFTNDDVLQRLPKVLTEIKAILDKSPSLGESLPLSPGEGRGETLTVFTTRPDTIFGVDFMVVAPEHDIVKKITTPGQQAEVDKYLKYVESRSEVERMAEVKKITGCFTGAYAVNPFNKKEIPIWISEYVLAGYGTGAIMGVPCGDERDHKFAKHFNLPITNIIGKHYNGTEANPTYDAILENSDFLNGLMMKDAGSVVVNKLEELEIGTKQVNYKMRDAGWSRQRYWGEPFPVVFRDDIPYAMNEKDLPLTLPASNNFKSSGSGEGPLANLKDWIHISDKERRDSNTMPTHAGAAWYFLRYMDPHNDKEFAGKKNLDYWGQVDVYVGGSEHAVAHLLYARLWVKILHDLGYLNFDEPFKKLINQGKITGVSKFVYRVTIRVSTRSGYSVLTPLLLVSKGYRDKWIHSILTDEVKKEMEVKALAQFKRNMKRPDYPTEKREEFIKDVDNLTAEINAIGEIHINSELASQEDGTSFEGWILDLTRFKNWCEKHWPEEKNFDYVLENGQYICGSAVEKMSKSLLNVTNPDEVIDKYGADTLRIYEMFLGPLEQSKPWSTHGIEGSYKFLRKFWTLFHDLQCNFKVSDAEPSREELKVLHKTLKKVEQDIENFSFNTSVSEFMICANELTSLKCNKRSVIEPLVIALSPFAPHIAEELWEKLGHGDTVLNAQFPKYNEEYLKENAFNYPISINGKVRAQMNFALDMPKEDIEKLVLASEIVLKWTEGKAPKKVIVVPGRIVNVVL